ncbi:hypothetical protein HU200_063843 [Digitaria exilis]|uniref:RNase H type-1 domain-containing protein n=1 Tax=Digitaria exilis TaxID=1010633 RepID=A0A835ACM8_9POAL|nr:hypothetical protein HU200_063843 [Digitaria exilis]
MEKSGIFSVRSAYSLGLKLANLDRSQASSSAPDGERKLWTHIWTGKKLAKDILPTRRAKFIRKIETGDQCTLCDREMENSFHAAVSCLQARGLRLAMREFWLLPDEDQFTYSGPDWLLLVLDKCSPVQRDLVKLVLWRAWSTHNNITHQSGPTSIHDGVQSLLSMGSRHGKQNINPASKRVWMAPPAGWCKINVDGSFVESTGDAGVGVVARDSAGKVVFTAWRVLFRCASAAEAEARACVEGFRLASQWKPDRVIIESDCARITQAIQHGELEWKISLVRRDCNSVANDLAQLARRTVHSAVWLGQAPACVMDIINSECNLNT